jgi:gliding motility-associated-like protein
MKRIFTLILLLIITASTYAQSGTWVWMGGDTSFLCLGNFGTKGVPSITNKPPGRYEANYWTDTSGNLWMFGGSSSLGELNDLWKYDIAAGIWTWVSGSNVPNAGPVYGVQGIPSVNNEPPNSSYGAACWITSDNCLWLYGGYFCGNDLWRYSISTNEWTWMKGDGIWPTFSGAPLLGTKGIADATVTPGPIIETKSSYTLNNELYLFGGGASLTGSFSNLMYKYLPTSNNWVWLSGDTTNNFNNGIKFVENDSVLPCNKLSYSRWIDKNNKLIVFGGDEVKNSIINRTNDAFGFNTITNKWSQLSYATIPNDTVGVNNGFCNPDSAASPPSIFEYSTVTTNDCNKTNWLFGGSSIVYYTNQLWSFNTINDNWTLHRGYNQVISIDTFGAQGVGAATNIPAARSGSAIWTDKQNNVWIFGGYKYYSKDSNNDPLFSVQNYSGDLWKYIPDYSCANIDPNSGLAYTFNAPASAICLGDSTIALLQNATSYTLSPLAAVSTTANGFVFYPSNTTTYTLIVNDNCNNIDTLNFTINITNPQSIFTIEPIVLLTPTATATTNNISNNATTYTWLNAANAIISTTTNTTVTFTDTGTICLSLVACNGSCCDTSQACVSAILPEALGIIVPNAFSPNMDGINDVFAIKTKGIRQLNFKIYNRFGTVVKELNSITDNWDGQKDNAPCDVGTYYYFGTYTDALGNKKESKGDIALIR